MHGQHTSTQMGPHHTAGLPVGFVSLLLGTLLAWFSKLIHTYDEFEADSVDSALGLHLPYPRLERWVGGFHHGWSYMTVIIPMFLVNFVTSLSNAEAAQTVGDRFPVTRIFLPQNK